MSSSISPMSSVVRTDRLRRLIAITFVESVVTVLLERGLYFYTDKHLDFSGVENLGIALVFGVFYCAMAMASGHACRRFGEKKLLRATIWMQILAMGVLLVHTNGYTITGVMVIWGILTGLKWPIVESYISAGRDPRAVARSVGQFNISWSAAVPIALVLVWPILKYWPADWPSGIFLLAAVLSVVSLIWIRPLEERPVHLSDDDPQRPSGDTLAWHRALMVSSRWTMFASYTLLFILAPLMPQIFSKLGYAIGISAALSSLMDVVRVVTFVILERWSGWHDRWWPAPLVVVGVPIGFLLVLYGNNLWMVLIGEVIFGLASGMTYYMALYYAMVVKNASVDASGQHEGLIGAGFAIGPATGLAAYGVASMAGMGTPSIAMMSIAVSPVLMVCAVGGLIPLLAWRKMK